jgi:hypothetical protein
VAWRSFSDGLLIVLVGAVLAGGCARVRPPLVRAHQRAHLADRIMRVDNDRLGQSADHHVMGTREGAFGGGGTAGGGCGCN